MPNRQDHRTRWTEGARREDDINWNDRDRSRDESRSWAGDRDFQRNEGYRPQGGGQYARDDDASAYRDRAYRDRADWGGRSSQDAYGYGAQGYEPSRSYGSGETWGRGPGRFEQAPRGGEFGRDYGVNRAYGRDHDQGRGPARTYGSGRDYEAQGYAPGAQIWQGSGRDMGRPDHEPDYLHWREQQMSKFDRDYDDWRNERRQKFSSDFDSWRSSRAENPVVGDVSDGGVGSQKDAKKD
ncbi:MAG: hypothetical protein KF910_09225 [Brevundimonas sp.]|uniref:hypothetical protein n=1 Tax=Brevundimonas sp. TaxID=1871086 RepID=UPI0025BD02B9|nr:hypothetical protein [Brevundimonas sp.]MBX3477778.1 hypothetical protein [Brevundimonas sp.]